MLILEGSYAESFKPGSVSHSAYLAYHWILLKKTINTI
jgi:hypothetical protein